MYKLLLALLLTCSIDPTALAAECQKKFACSTSVQALPGKNNPGQEVILQVRSCCDTLPAVVLVCIGHVFDHVHLTVIENALWLLLVLTLLAGQRY